MDQKRIEELSAQLADKDYLIRMQADEIERLRADVKRQQEKMIELAAGLPKLGKWIDDEFTSKGRCSVCGEEWSWFDNCMETFKYCPNCGAKMIGEQNVE